MLEPFIWFGGVNCPEIIFDLKKLSDFEIHDYFLACILDEFLQIGPPEQKVEILAENLRYIFCRSSKYLPCGGITLVHSVLVFARKFFFKLV